MIYKSSYAGWYAVSDEAYYPATQVEEVVDPSTGDKYMVRHPHLVPFSMRERWLTLASCYSQASTETGTKVEWMEEENYKFKLSAFRERLLEWLSQDPSREQLALKLSCSRQKAS